MNHSFESLEELLHTVRKTGNPSTEDRRAVRRALSGLFATAVTTSTAVAAAATKTVLFSSFLWPFATGALLGGAVIATTTVASRSEMFEKWMPPTATVAAPPAVPPAAVPRAEPPVAPSELSPPGELPSAAAFPSNEKPPVPPSPEVRPPAPPRTLAPAAVVSEPASPRAEPRTPQTLEAESRALAEAQRALRDEDAEWALSMLVEQDRRFAGGVLAEERAAARVLATCAAGRLADGRAAAERFQSQYPRSLHTERVRQACEP